MKIRAPKTIKKNSEETNYLGNRKKKIFSEEKNRCCSQETRTECQKKRTLREKEDI